jgi:UDP-glucose 4-epimerase
VWNDTVPVLPREELSDVSRVTELEMELDGSTVLVTGGAGFIGSHLADELVGTAKVRVLDDLSGGDPARVPDDAELFRGSVLDDELLASAVSGVDVVFHQAAVTSVQRSVEEPLESHRINVDGTVSVLEAARAEQARVVAASSAAVYGRPESLPIHEGQSKSPSSPYGIDKLALDLYVRRYAELYGLETVVLRYFNVYGPRQDKGRYSGVISVFIEQALSGGPITVHGDGSQTRDFVHVDDVVRANLLAATTDRTGRAYNVGTGRAITVGRLARLVRELTGPEPEIVHTDPREGDIDRSRASLERSEAELDYSPQVRFERGIDRLVDAVA